MQAWNAHKLQVRGERPRTPRDRFMFGMVSEGPRGIQQFLTPPEETIDDLASYGVDWDVHDDPAMMTHLLQQNPQDWDDSNPFSSATNPDHMNTVECEPPGCPLTATQVDTLNHQLRSQFDVHSRNMQQRRLMWQTALRICDQVLTL